MISVLTATYRDAAGVDQVVPIDAIETFGSEVSPAAAWPWTGLALRREAIRIRYTAGYPDAIPAPIRVAILLMVGDMYRNRVTTQSGSQSVVPMSTKVEDLLAPFRVYR